MSNALPTRNDIEQKYKWQLTDIITDQEEWQAYYDEVTDICNHVASLQGKLADSADILLDALSSKDTAGSKFSRLYAFSLMRLHLDTTKGESQEAAEKVNALQATALSSLSFIEPELIGIPEDTIASFIDAKPELNLYTHYFADLQRQKEHILPTEQEMLLASLTDFADSPSKIFSMFNDADMKFPDVIDAEGNPAPLTKGNFVQYLESGDSKVRATAFKTLYDTYKKNDNTLAAILTSQLKKDTFMMKARKFDSTCQASLFDKNIDVSVYDNLIEAVNDNMSLLHRYVGLRKKILGMDELHMYDLYMPMIQEAKEEISYDDARATVRTALEVMGEDYTATLDKAFDSNWIDVYETEGKRSGAYSWGTYEVHPYILLNHQDNIKSMFTLAHELGHTMHSYYSSAEQPFVYANYPIFLAEVASTVNEALLLQYLLKTTTDRKKRMFLLNHYMESFRTTLYRQTMFAEYEKVTHELVEKGEALTAERLSSIYYDLNKKYYGEDIVVDEEIAMEWARIPHFYYNYYVYQYATGFSSAIAIAKDILENGEKAVDNYKVFLKSGCSRYPLDTLKAAGVDMTTKAPIESALKVFESVLDEMEELIAEQ